MVAITAGESHSIVLKTNGTVWAWGDHYDGELGDDYTGVQCAPVQTHNIGSVVAVAAGQYHTLAVKSNGTMMAWGSNNNGQLGNGNYLNQHTPVAVLNFTGVTSASRCTHSIALKSDGSIWSFGTNVHGQLGNGTNANSNIRTQLVNLVLGPQVARPTFNPEGGFYLQPQSVTVSCATAGATIHYTTNGNEPQSPIQSLSRDPALALQTFPFCVRRLLTRGRPRITKSGVYHIGGIIAAGLTHSLAIESDGVLWTWGYNYYGQLGTGDTVDRWLPTSVSGLSNVVAAAGGGYHSLAVEADGSVWAWGDNTWGQLGNGTQTQRDWPVQVSQVSGFTNLVAVAGGWDHSVALKSDGTVWAWGWNSSGQLGDGSTTNRFTPVQVSGLNGVVAISAGAEFTVALKSDGKQSGHGATIITGS